MNQKQKEMLGLLVILFFAGIVACLLLEENGSDFSVQNARIEKPAQPQTTTKASNSDSASPQTKLHR